MLEQASKLYRVLLNEQQKTIESERKLTEKWNIFLKEKEDFLKGQDVFDKKTNRLKHLIAMQREELKMERMALEQEKKNKNNWL